MASSSNMGSQGGPAASGNSSDDPSHLPTIVTTTSDQGANTSNAEAEAGPSRTAAAPAINTSPSSAPHHPPPSASRVHHHRNTSSLASAAGMLQVPGGPSTSHDAPEASSSSSSPIRDRSGSVGAGAGSHDMLGSPTLSAYSDLSGVGAEPPLTTRALRDVDNEKEPAQQEEDESEDAITTSAAPAASTSAAAAAADAEKQANSSHSTDAPRAPIAIAADREAERRSHWSRFKALITGNTRSARAAAAARAVEEEKERQKNVDPRPFHFKPYALAELVDPKSVEGLREMGGIEGLLEGLGTDGERGLDLPIRVAEAQVSGEKAAPQRVADVEDQQGSKIARKPVTVDASLEDRERVFGRNVLPQKKAKSLLLLMWIALQDKVLIILIIAAIVSLVLGFYTDFVAPPELLPCLESPDGLCEAPDVDWVEGLAILIAVTVVVTVGSVNDYGKERQLQKLNAQKEERDVKVIRQGKPGLMSVHDVQVGDVLQLEPGEVIPADGVFLRGHNVKCDESGATGESDLIKKASYADCLSDLSLAHPSKRDPFLISGSRVQEGVGEYVVTSVGTMSFNGKLMMSLHSEAEDTPLQAKLNHLAEIIAKLGAAAGLLLFIVLFIRFLAQLKDFPGTANDKGQRFIQVLILAVTVVVVAIPEGLPLAVTLALAFATRRMAKQNLLVRLLGSCETMGAATVICTDKTGTLTQNQMSVVAGSVGVHCKFVRQLENHRGRAAAEEGSGGKGGGDWAIDQANLGDVVDGPLRELFNDSIAVNSTAFEEEPEEGEADKKKGVTAPLAKLKALFSRNSTATPTSKAASSNGNNNFVGSKTETALLSLAKDLHWPDYRLRRKANEVVTSYPFSSERKAMGVVVKKRDEDGGGYRFFVKGASEVITALCKEVVQVQKSGSEGGEVVTTAEISEEDRANLTRSIAFYANQTLRTLGLAYKDFESWPPAGATFVQSTSTSDGGDGGESTGEVDYRSIATDLTLLSVVAIEDPLRDGVAQAVQATYRAGLRVIMVTGDNSLTARSIAAQCGIFDPAAQGPDKAVILEGPIFRKMSDDEVRDIAPRLRVLARSSPQDKEKLVSALKSMGEIVAVTGDGTNDAAALKQASVGFAMNICGTETAKEAADIVLLDDRFSSIVTALLWGRCVRNAVRKFLQFQLAVNVGAVVITFVTSVASEDESGALTAVQLLWLNLLMDSLAALALATDPPSDELLKQKPERPNTSLISIDMWKMILGQATYQVALVLVLYFAGANLFGIAAAPGDDIGRYAAETTIKALTFNTFVFTTLFNQVNARRLDRRFNIFQDLLKNPWFIAILAFEVGAQVLIMFVGGKAFSVEQLPGKYWAVSLVAGFISWPLGVLIKLIPTEPIERFAIRWGLMADPLALPYDAPDAEEAHEKLRRQRWTEQGLMDLADELGGYSRRGKRATLLSSGWSELLSILRHPREALPHKMSLHSIGGDDHHHRDDVHPSKFGVLMPGLAVAGLAGAWRPQNPPEATLADPAAGDPSLSSWQLMRRGTNLHDDEEGEEQHAGKGVNRKASSTLKGKFKGLMGGGVEKDGK